MNNRLKAGDARFWWLRAGLLLALLALAACGLSPEAKEARFLAAGKKALADKDYSRAIIQFRNAIRLKKNHAEGYYQLGLACIGIGDGPSALKAFWAAADLDPKRADAQVKIAELMMSSRDQEQMEKAQRRLGGVLQTSPENAEALTALAVTEWNLGSPGDAETHLQRVLANFPKNMQAVVTLAQLRRQNKDFKGAEEVLKTAAGQQPPVPEAIIALAEFYAIMKRDADAEQQFRRALQVDPKNALALYDLGNLLARSGKLDQAEPFYRELSNLPDRRYKLSHATFLFNNGKTQPAVVEFEKLAKDNPDDRIARSMLIQAYWRAGRPVDAAKVLERALKANPKDADALIQRSAVYLGAKKYPEAEADLNQALRFKPDSAQAHYLLSRLHLSREAVLAQRQELGEALRLKNDFLQARLELARSLMSAKAPKAALDLINLAPGAQKNTLAVIIQRNWALLATGDTAGLSKGVDDGLAIQRAPDLLLQSAILKLQAHDVTGARVLVDQAIDLNPRDIRGLDLMVMTYRVQKQPAGVLPKLREIAAKHHDSLPIQTILGDWLLSSGDHAEARAVFSAALKQNANYAPAAIGLARAAVTEGKLDDARSVLASAASSDPANRNVTFMLANVEELAGNRAKALDLYNRVLASDPSNALALNNVAFLLADYAQKPDEALKYAQRAKELSPDDPDVEDTLGWVLYRKGIYDIALRHLEAAVSSGSTAERQYHLAAAYLRTGNRKRSEQALQAALQLNPNLPEALQLRSQLRAASQKSQN